MLESFQASLAELGPSRHCPAPGTIWERPNGWEYLNFATALLPDTGFFSQLGPASCGALLQADLQGTKALGIQRPWISPRRGSVASKNSGPEDVPANPGPPNHVNKTWIKKFR